MNLTQLLAQLLEGFKIKNPKWWPVIQALLGAILYTLSQIDLGGSEAWIQNSVIALMALLSSSTKNYLPDTHPAKKKIQAEVYKEADKIVEKLNSDK